MDVARMNLADDEDEDDLEALQARFVDRAERCIRALLVAIGRDYLHCGKAACARSRRCRGFACEPDTGHLLTAEWNHADALARQAAAVKESNKVL